MKKTRQLRALLARRSPEFLLEAHNGLSARVAEEAGFPALWASGLSIAAFTYAGIAVKARNAAVQSEKAAVRERNAAVAARDLAERRLWLAQRAAEEVRFQMDLASKQPNCPPR